jgi:hypothetical protein
MKEYTKVKVEVRFWSNLSSAQIDELNKLAAAMERKLLRWGDKHNLAANGEAVGGMFVTHLDN